MLTNACWIRKTGVVFRDVSTGQKAKIFKHMLGIKCKGSSCVVFLR